MSDFRPLLAVVAALLAIVFSTVWFLSGRQRSTKRGGGFLVYAILLLVSAVVLWQKSEKATSTSPVDVDSIAKTPIAETGAQESMGDSSEQVSSQEREIGRHLDSDLNKEPSQEAAVWTKSKVLMPLTEGRLGSPKRHLPSGHSTDNGSALRSNRPAVEDLIESRILDAFDFIEVLFLKYGSLAESSEIHPKHGAASSTIEFVIGSNELSQRSIRYLRGLAPELARQYSSGNLEIRAETSESFASPGERLNLTKSRAEAIKDVLVAEGFPADRIVTVGTERAGETRVKFIHRHK